MPAPGWQSARDSRQDARQLLYDCHQRLPAARQGVLLVGFKHLRATLQGALDLDQ